MLSSALAGVAPGAATRAGPRSAAIAGSLVVNGVLYVLAFRVLTPKQIGPRGLLPGALAGAAMWTVLQNVGTALVEHQLRNASQVYGTFAAVLGLIAWIYLGANLTMYAAEANVVWARRLWPRSLVPPPLTAADEEVLAAIVKQGQRRPEQTGERRVRARPARRVTGAAGAARPTSARPSGDPRQSAAVPASPRRRRPTPAPAEDVVDVLGQVEGHLRRAPPRGRPRGPGRCGPAGPPRSARTGGRPAPSDGPRRSAAPGPAA